MFRRDRYRDIGPGNPGDVALRSKLYKSILERVQSLEQKREDLRLEVRTLEKKCRTATEFNFNYSDNTNILTQCKLFGYFLSNCYSKETGDNLKQYTACCEDSRHPFSIAVTTKGNDVAAVDVSLPEASPLHEIKIILNNLSEDNCPYLVLTTIQQFIHLNNFRNKIINDKLKGSFGTRCNFRVYPPDLSKGQRHFQIIGKQESIKITWTIAFEKADHSLVHEISIPKIPPNQDLERLKNDLLDQIFTNRNASDLWDWWAAFLNAVALSC